MLVIVSNSTVTIKRAVNYFRITNMFLLSDAIQTLYCVYLIIHVWTVFCNTRCYYIKSLFSLHLVVQDVITHNVYFPAFHKNYSLFFNVARDDIRIFLIT